jgi:hypothetical protein
MKQEPELTVQKIDLLDGFTFRALLRLHFFIPPHTYDLPKSLPVYKVLYPMGA